MRGGPTRQAGVPRGDATGRRRVLGLPRTWFNVPCDMGFQLESAVRLAFFSLGLRCRYWMGGMRCCVGSSAMVQRVCWVCGVLGGLSSQLDVPSVIVQHPALPCILSREVREVLAEYVA